jgi:hypothetical protein
MEGVAALYATFSLVRDCQDHSWIIFAKPYRISVGRNLLAALAY